MAMPTNWARVLFVYGNDTVRPFVCVCYYELSAAPAGDPQIFANAVATNVSAAFIADAVEVLTDLSLVYGFVAQVHLGGVTYNGETSGSPVGGTVESTDEMPNYVAVVIQKRTAQPGKSGRGRWYMGAVPESFTDTNKLTTTAFDQYKTLAEHFNETVVVSGINLAPRHYSKKNETLYPIVQCRVNKTLATQRRRRVRPILDS